MYIKVNVKAGAKRESVIKNADNRFEISVKEPAKQNLANKRIREILAEFYAVDIGNIRLINGHHSPRKLYAVECEE